MTAMPRVESKGQEPTADSRHMAAKDQLGEGKGSVAAPLVP